MSDQKPTCAVRGLIQPRVMCGYVIVGGKFCGYSGECPHQVAPVNSEGKSGAQDAAPDAGGAQ